MQGHVDDELVRVDTYSSVAWVVYVSQHSFEDSCTFVPGMVPRGSGHVINIASLAGLALAPGMISYNTAKAAVVAFSESLRVEVALSNRYRSPQKRLPRICDWKP